MSGRPKFSVFRPWVEPSPSRKTNGDRLRLLTAVVALLFVPADRLGRVKDRTDASLGRGSPTLMSLTLSPPERSGDQAGFSARFQLSNRDTMLSAIRCRNERADPTTDRTDIPDRKSVV